MTGWPPVTPEARAGGVRRGRGLPRIPGATDSDTAGWRLPAGSAPGAGGTRGVGTSEEHRSMNSVQRPDSFEMADYMGVLRRRWWIIVVGACVGLAGAFAYVTVAPKTYTA